MQHHRFLFLGETERCFKLTEVKPIFIVQVVLKKLLITNALFFKYSGLLQANLITWKARLEWVP